MRTEVTLYFRFEGMDARGALKWLAQARCGPDVAEVKEWDPFGQDAEAAATVKLDATDDRLPLLVLLKHRNDILGERDASPADHYTEEEPDRARRTIGWY